MVGCVRPENQAGQARGVLLLDNAPSHSTTGLELSNVRVCFLPPNTTSRLQPMDQGIIAAFKKMFRIYQLDYSLYVDAAGEHDIYKVDILKAMRWCKSCMA